MPLLDEIPEWARVFEASDPVSLQPNRNEATETKKDTGFDFQEFVTRQDLNYLQNLNGRWIKSFRNMNGTLIRGFEHTGIFDEGGSTWSISFKKGVATSSNKEMFFDANVDGGWPGALLKKFITGGNFTAGDGNPGLATTLTLGVDIWYHAFVIRLTSGAIDVGFDTSVVAANLVANDGVTHWRRISSFFWGNITSGWSEGLHFKQNGDYFYPIEKVQSNAVTLTLLSGLDTLSVVVPQIPKDFRSKILWNFAPSTGPDTEVSFMSIFGDEQLPEDAGFLPSLDIIRPTTENSPVWTFHDGVQQKLNIKANIVSDANIIIQGEYNFYIDERGRNDF